MSKWYFKQFDTVESVATHYVPTEGFQAKQLYDGEIHLYVECRTISSYVITQQASMDGLDFYDVVDAYNASAGAVLTVADDTAHSRYIQVDPVRAPWMRWKVVISETAGAVSVKMALQEE